MSESPCHLLVLSGPSGVGKDYLLQALCQDMPQIKRTVSATTRPVRNGEIDGIDYYFYNEDDFTEAIKHDELVEWCHYATFRYGTLHEELEKKMNGGGLTILKLDVEGAYNIRKDYPQAKRLFIAPPSFEILQSRLEGRGTESPEEIAGRISRAKEEMTFADDFDFIVVNDDAGTALAELHEIVSNLLQPAQASR